MNITTPEEIIRRLELVPLSEEGGYFRQVYKSTLQVEADGKIRSAATLIYYLVTPDDFSTLHRVQHDEVFHFYAGDPVESVSFDTNRPLKREILGSRFLEDESSFMVIERGLWQGLRLIDGGHWALLGCQVAPGYEQVDFESGDRKRLQTDFPKYAELIQKYTR